MQSIHILQINTAYGEASISISKDGHLLHEIRNANQYDHAAFLQPAILEACQKCGLELNSLQAISVINGPGSYTGLRVGLSSAKGICYALKIPIICVNTLYWMAVGNAADENDLICAMIDARRNEVFTAIYNYKGEKILEPTAMVLDENSFTVFLQQRKILFIGDGAKKFQSICNHPNASFPESEHNTEHLSLISYNAFKNKKFEDLISVEPNYVKGFYSTQNK